MSLCTRELSSHRKESEHPVRFSNLSFVFVRDVCTSRHYTEKRLIGIMGRSGVVRINGVVDEYEEEKWRAMRARAGLGLGGDDDGEVND